VIGTFLLPPEGREGDRLFFGASQSLEGFLRAMRDHGGIPHCKIFTPPSLLAETSRYLKRLTRRGMSGSTPPWHVFSTTELLEGVDGFGIRVWHDTLGTATSPFHVRRLLARRPFPITMVAHTASDSRLLHNFFLRLLVQSMRSFDSLICASPTAYTAVSRMIDSVARALEDEHHIRLRFKGRLDVIPLGVDANSFRPTSRSPARRKLGLDTGAFVLLWLGRISVSDKADLLPMIRILRKLVAMNPRREVRLVIAGRSLLNETDVISHYARQLGVRHRVTFVPDVSADDRVRLYGAADVFVAPADSVQETFGITPIEAMACGIPQVVADWNGYRDSVIDGETGFRIPTTWGRCDADLRVIGQLPGNNLLDHRALGQSVAVDMECYVRSIQQLIDSSDLQGRMSRASRARAVAVYDWGHVIAQYQQLWEELALMAEKQGSTLTRSYADPAFFEVFGGYASRIVDGKTRLRLSADGRQLHRGRELLPTYYMDGIALEAATMEEVVRTLGRLRAHGSSTAEDAVMALRRRTRKGEAFLMRHLLWLLKYGFAEIT
jgi:D-inositol-3-phosphate glycosyltransferase